MMSIRRPAALLLPALVLLTLQVRAQVAPIDARFRELIDASEIGRSIKRLSAEPHHVGSPYGRDNAEWILARFREWGWQAEIESFDVLFPTPAERVLEMVAPVRFTASLTEPAVADDPSSTSLAGQLPGYNAYSADGDVTAPLVYVNYGRPADYEELARRNISVKGAIVIARYGGSWRGIKPKVAAEHGAVGCILYSDPRDDGYFVEDVFPRGPMRPRDGVQRGSVMDMPLYPGDPLTPGVGATPGATRLPLSEARTLTTIPVLPISYGDAQPLLDAITGPIAPVDWRGSLPITYRIGPGAARVRLKVRSNWDLKPVHNVIARLPGSEHPDEWVIRGNHHDAWVLGALDPSSGMAAALEEARALGTLYRGGWRPKRTIVYAAWDGEEPSLLGSTEWVETHLAELQQRAVAYINTDAYGRGFLQANGSHALEQFVNQAAKSVQDPDAGMSLWQRLQASTIATGSPALRAEARTRPDLRLNALGGGSDFTAFIHHAGIPTIDLALRGLSSSGGIYHSAYDSYYHFSTFIDPTFAYGKAFAQMTGTLVLGLADADMLPFEFTNLAETVQGYVREVQALLRERQEAVGEQNRQIQDGVLSAVNDKGQPLSLPAVEEVPPALNFAPLENAVTAFTTAAQRYRAAARAVTGTLDRDTLRAVNAQLRISERALTDPEGLPGRPWFRHVLYASGFYTGYDVKTLPGIREAIEQKRYGEAEREVARAARAIERATAVIGDAASRLERARQ